MTLEEYLNLVPSANRDKPDFIAALSIGLSIQVRLQGLLDQMAGPLFDVDVAAGDQLDIIGLWVGVSREVDIPVPGVYFHWDGTDYTLGWDYGVWQPSSGPSEVTILPDDSYRQLIKFKIAANHWDGTTDGAYKIWAVLFPALLFLILDYQDMTYSLAILGGPIDSLTLALITGGAIALKPEGVRIRSYFIPFDTGPVFSWDAENANLKGWDESSWAYEIPPTA